MAKEQKHVLGKGLGALFGDDLLTGDLTGKTGKKGKEPTQEADPSDKAKAVRDALKIQDQAPAAETEEKAEIDRILMLAIDDIGANPWQPRQNFDEDALTDLTESIKSQGILQPLLVVSRDGGYILVAGERRLRAAKRAGLKKVPAIVRPLNEEEMARIALIENIQRTDLTAIEEARGYAALMDRYGYTQQQLASLMGKSRPYVANLLRLLDLPPAVMQALDKGQISAGHARALLAVHDQDLCADLLRDCIDQNWSVRLLEDKIRLIHDYDPLKDHPDRAKPHRQAQSRKWTAVSDQLSDRLQTKVHIKDNGKEGRLIIDFYGDQDLTRILDALNIQLY